MRTSDKTTLRRSMREVRRQLPDRPARSKRIGSHLIVLPAVVSATRVMVFTTVPGEPEMEPFVDWCRASAKEVAVPEDGVDSSWPDVVIVPGLAFTALGDRLGQGGGWYDRFLPNVRGTCTAIGVCFDPQLVGSLPVEVHDVRLDLVVTESGQVSTS